MCGLKRELGPKGDIVESAVHIIAVQVAVGAIYAPKDALRPRLRPDKPSGSLT